MQALVFRPLFTFLDLRSAVDILEESTVSIFGLRPPQNCYISGASH